MKKTTTIFVMMFLVFGMMTFVSAEELEIEEAGQVPGNFFYGFDKAMDNFKISMTFNKERKAERAMIAAEERLAEYEKLIENGENERAEQVKLSYDRYIERSEKAMEKIESGSNSEHDFRSAAKIQERTESHQERIDEIHTRILEKHSENMTDEQLERFEEIFSKIKDKSLEIGENAALRKEQLLIKHKVFAEMTEEEIAEFENMVENEEGIHELRQNRELRHEDRFNRSIEVRERNLDRMKELLSNENLTEEEVTAIQERIELHESNFNQFGERKEELRNKFALRNNSENLTAEERLIFAQEHRNKDGKGNGNGFRKMAPLDSAN